MAARWEAAGSLASAAEARTGRGLSVGTKHTTEESDDKFEAIARRVGYDSAVVFSRAFIRCVGMTPSHYRERRAGA